MPSAIQWPSQREMEDIASSFAGIGSRSFPNILGFIDGSHIPLITPLENAEAFINHKKFHPLVLQGVCREDLRFTDVCVGYPRRTHEARVLQNSDIWETGYSMCQMGEYHIIGDAANPLTD